jgi:hypothetical protein
MPDWTPIGCTAGWPDHQHHAVLCTVLRWARDGGYGIGDAGLFWGALGVDFDAAMEHDQAARSHHQEMRA